MEKAAKSKASKSKKKKVKSSSKALPKYKVVKMANPLLKKLNPKLLRKALYYKKCSIKSGFLNIVQKRPKLPSNLTIKVMPIFVKLTNTNLIISQTPYSKKPLSTFPLTNILRIDQHYYNTNCLDIITTRIPKKKAQLSQGILTLCADSFALKSEWVLKILEFKQCKLAKENVDQNQLIIMDFDNINRVKLKHNVKNYSLGHLYYDGRDTVYKKKGNNNSKTSRIKTAFKRIKLNINRGDLATQQIRRQYVGRLRKARNFAQGVHERTRMLKNNFAKKMMMEKERESSILKMIHNKKEVSMIRTAMSTITEFKVVYSLNLGK